MERGERLAEVYCYPSDSVHQLRKALAAKAGVEHVSLLSHQGQPLADHLSVVDAGLQNHSEVDMSVVWELAVGSGSADGDVRIWDAKQGQFLDTLKAHSEPVLCTAFSPSGELMATASADGSARVWSTGTSECMAVLEGHSDWVSSVVFSPDEQALATTSMDCHAKLWDVQFGSCIRTFKGKISPLFSASFSLDARLLAAGGAPAATDVQIWNVETGESAQALLGSGSGAEGGHQDNVLCVCFSADGWRILSGGQDKTAKIWDVKKSECVVTFSGHTDSVAAACFTPDSKLVVTASHDRSLKIWDAVSSQCLKTLQGHCGSIVSAAVAPDSQTIVSGSRDATVRLWDFKSGRCLQVMEGHKGKVNSVAYVPF